MSDELNKVDYLVGTTLKLRSALSIAMLALGKIEGAEPTENARAIARAARLEVRAVLSTEAVGAKKDR